MFTNDKRQEERTGKYGTPRHNHLQHLVTEFQTPTISQLSREKTVANLANFAYDPYNFSSLRSLNILELFLDCLSDEPNERVTEFAVGGICNAVVEPQNAKIVIDCGGVAALIGCLVSPVRNTVKYSIAALFYLCDNGGCEVRVCLKERGDWIELIERFCQVDGFSNLANALLDKIMEE